MKRPAFSTQVKKADAIILIVDKIGVIGEKLAEEYSKDFYVVLFSARPPSFKSDKLSFLPFKGRIPKIPQNKYSKIFLIDDGKTITKESSVSFVEEAKLIGAEFYFLGSVRNYDIKHTDELVKNYSKVKVLVFGDLFDKDYLFDSRAPITKFIIEATNKKRINVPGNGLSLSYPITFKDTVKLILRASYLKIPQNIILLFYKNPITDISLAHAFQKIEPDIDVDFIEEKDKQKLFVPKGAEYAISNYNIKEKLEDLEFTRSKKIILSEKKKKSYSPKFLRYFLSLLILVVFLFLLPVATTYSYALFGKIALKNSVENIKSGEYEKSLKSVENAKSFFNIAEKTADITKYQFELLGNGKYLQNLSTEINSGRLTSSALENLLNGAIIINEVFDNGNSSEKESFESGLEYLSSSYSEFQKINISRDKDVSSFDSISNVFNVIGMINGVSEVLPEVLGFNEEKNYLVVFQDNNELRPGGGKISSVGKLKIKDFKIISFEIFSTEAFDKNLKVYVEPPYALKRYLPTENLYLKDSNFNPDFVEGSIAISAIYKLETEEEIDGIIGVDLFFLKNLLNEIGPVYLSEYGKNVTSENIFQIAEEAGEENNFTNKLVKEVLVALEKGKGITLPAFMNVLEKSILEKHILFAFKDPEAQRVFVTNNYSGSLIDSRATSQNKLNDFIGISEANLGKNKINFFISRSLTKKNIIAEDGSMSSEVTIAFKNSSQRGSSFAKTYRNYIRVILPSDTIIDEISVGGKRQDLLPAITDASVYEDSRFSDPDGLEIEQVRNNDKFQFGFLMSVPPDSIETIKLKYSLPFKVLTETNSVTDYSLQIYKQPGIDSFPFGLSFESASDFTVLPINTVSVDIKNDEILEFIISKN